MCKEKEEKRIVPEYSDTRYSDKVTSSYNVQMEKLDKLFYFLGIKVNSIETRHTTKTPITKFTCTKDGNKIVLEVSSTGIKLLKVNRY